MTSGAEGDRKSPDAVRVKRCPRRSGVDGVSDGEASEPEVEERDAAEREKAEMARKIKIKVGAFRAGGGLPACGSKKKEQGDEGELSAHFGVEQLAEDDYFMVKVFLKSYLADVSFNVSELAQLIIAQREEIGSAIVVTGQEDLFGFMTVVSCKTHRQKSCIQSILKYVRGKVLNSSRYEEWERILEDPSVNLGLVVSERICNLPHKLGPPMNLITLEEVRGSGETFDYYLILTNRYKEADEFEAASVLPPAAKKSRGGGGANRATAGDSVYEYYKVEDEVYRECAFLEHSIRLKKHNDSRVWTLGRFTKMSKLFMLVAGAEVPRVVARLKELSEAM